MLRRRSLAGVAAALAVLWLGYASALPLWPGGAGAGGPVALTTITVVEPSGSTQTNVPVSLGMPFAAGVIDSSHSVQCTDGNSNTDLVQEDTRASNLTPSVQTESLTAIIPSLTASQTLTLTCTVNSGAPATGTDITVANITAVASSSLNALLTLTNLNGVAGSWTADPMTALNSGNSGWVNTTTATVLGKFRNGGGLVTEYVLFVPFAKSGTADAQMHAIFDVVCYKASRAAVSGGNAILGCRTDSIVENAYIQAATPVDNYYGFSGSGSTFANSTPAITLTLGQSAAGANISLSAASSLFSCPNSIGGLISNGTGIAVINGCTNATTAQVAIYKAFGSTTVTSGTYTIYGINHPWGARYKFRAFWGPSVTPNWPTVDAGNVNIGAAWNNGALTGGPFSYIAATKLIMNYATSATTCGATSMTNLNNVGTNPSSYLNGGGQFDAGGTNGDLLVFLGQTGVVASIGVIPDWDVCGLIRYDSNAAARIFGNATRWASLPIGWRDNTTGLVTSPCNAGSSPTCTGNTNWTAFAGGGTAIAQPTNPITPWSPDAFAHDPEDFYVAYVLTGDFFWLESQQFSAFYAWAGDDPSFSGTGLQKSVYASVSTGPNGAGYQERGRSWALRTITDATLFAPDTNSAVLGVSKAIWQTLLANEYIGAHGGVTLYANDNTNYASDGPRWTYYNNYGFSSFESGYGCFALMHQSEQGMLDTNGITMRNWLCEGEASLVNDTSQVSPPYTLHMQYFVINDTTSACPGTLQNSWTNVYKATASNYIPGISALGLARIPSATLTLSATSGASVTATFSGGGYFATTTFYPGMWIAAFTGSPSSPTYVGSARIVSVTNSNVVVVDTTASHTYWISSCASDAGSTFTSTSYASGQVAIPMAAPGDPAGSDWTNYLSSPTDDYLQIVQANTLLMSEYGMSGGSAACATSWGYTNSSAGCGIAPMSIFTPKWVIQSR